MHVEWKPCFPIFVERAFLEVFGAITIIRSTLPV